MKQESRNGKQQKETRNTMQETRTHIRNKKHTWETRKRNKKQTRRTKKHGSHIRGQETRQIRNKKQET